MKEPYVEMIEKNQNCIHPNFQMLPSLDPISHEHNPIYEEVKFGGFSLIDEFVYNLKNMTLNRILKHALRTTYDWYVENGRIIFPWNM